MEAKTGMAAEASTGSRTMADMPYLSAEKNADTVAFKYKDGGQWTDITYKELGEKVGELAKGLIALDIKRKDRIAILCNSRPEWSYFDYAALSTGATVAPIYQTNSPEECQYVLEHSESRLIIVEDEKQLEKIRKISDNLPLLDHIVILGDQSHDDVISTSDLVERGKDVSDEVLKERVASVSPDDICTIIYTSGTTGPPKGCVVTHGNYRSMLDMVESEAQLEAGQVAYLFLPLAHSFARLIAFASVDVGATLGFFTAIPNIVPDLMELKPSYFPSVPRMFEKIYSMATSVAEKAGPEKQEKFRRAIEIGTEVRKLRLEGKEPEGELAENFELADREMFSNVRNLFGGNIKTAVSGGAPIAQEILEFFWACGILVLEGYGMTETSTVSTINRDDDFKFGSVGKPLPGCEIKIADDGEVLIKGPNIFQGYWKDESATDEAIVDEWLHTGDIGKIDEDGFLHITGRKKDIIITAGGKNITPANIENSLKQNQFISEAVVHGDRRPYLTTLVTLDPEEIVPWAQEAGLEKTDLASLAQDQKVRELIQKAFDKTNEKIARVEQIKKFTILPVLLTQETGELTPSLKVKRNVVNEKFVKELDAMYEN